MDETKKRLYGRVYLGIAYVSIMYGLYYTVETLSYFTVGWQAAPGKGHTRGT